MSALGGDVGGIVEDFAAGVLTTPEAEALPSNALTQAVNIVLRGGANGRAIAMQRPGWRYDPLSGVGTAVHLPWRHGYVHRYVNGDQVAVLQGDAGSILTLAVPTLTTPSALGVITSATRPFAALSIRDMACYADEVLVRKLVRTGTGPEDVTAYPFGLTVPDIAPSLSTALAGSMTDTYDVAVTCYNATTGVESSRGPSATTGAITSKQIAVDCTSIIAGAEAQTTHIRIYLRQQSISGDFYLATTIPIATLTATLNIDTDAFNALSTLAPTRTSNDPPPTTTRLLAVFKGRTIAATSTTLYWSKVFEYEAFDLDVFLEVAPQDGQEITAMAVDPSDPSTLLIWKTASLYALRGEGPAEWTLSLVDASLGCVSHRTLVQGKQRIWWMSALGPAMYEAGAPRLLHLGRVEELFAPERFAVDQFSTLAHTWYEENDDRVVFFLPQIGQDSANIAIAYNARLDAWEGEWTGIRWAVVASCFDAQSVRRSFGLPVANGYLYWWDHTLASDGHTPDATANTYALVTGAEEMTTLTLDIAGATVPAVAYVGLPFVLTTSVGEIAAVGEILTYSGVTLTPRRTLTGLTAGTTYYLQVGAIPSEIRSVWFDGGRPFDRKRIGTCYWQLRGGTETVSSATALYPDDRTAARPPLVRGQLYVDYATAPTVTWALDSDTGNAWGYNTSAPFSGTSTWNTTPWGPALGVATTRTRAGVAGRVVQLGWTVGSLFQSITFLKGAWSGEVLSDKR